MRRFKRLLKFFFLIEDYILLFFFLPYLVKKTKKVHLSFDDVKFESRNSDLYIDDHYAKFLSEDISVPMDLFFLKQETNVCYGSKINNKIFKWNFHLPSMYGSMVYIPTSYYTRFHYFKATRSDVLKFKKFGGKVLLTSNDNYRNSYDLNSKETKKLNLYHIYYKNGIIYRKTDIRLEKLLTYQLWKVRNFEEIVIFGHEWGFVQYKHRLKLLIKFLKKKNVDFLN